MPKFLNLILGGFWTRFLEKKYLPIFIIGVAVVMFGNFQSNKVIETCEIVSQNENLDTLPTESTKLEKLNYYLIETTDQSEACAEFLPKANLPGYLTEEMVDENALNLTAAKNDWSQGSQSASDYQAYLESIKTYNENIRSFNAKNNSINNAFVVLLGVPTIVMTLLMILIFFSYLLLFICNNLVRSWGNNLGLSDLTLLSKRVTKNVGEVVINDIKYGQIRETLAKQFGLYRDLIEGIQEYVTESVEDSISSSEEDSLGGEVVTVNPKYVISVTPMAAGSSSKMFNNVVQISRNEIIDLFESSCNENVSKLYSSSPYSFIETSMLDFQEKLEEYIKKILSRGILDLENSSIPSIRQKKEDLRIELWLNDQIIKEPLEKIVNASKNTPLMQMIDSYNLELLDKQNTNWKFIKFLPESTTNWFDTIVRAKDEFVVTEYSETAGYLRLIPVSKQNMDIVI